MDSRLSRRDAFGKIRGNVYRKECQEKKVRYASAQDWKFIDIQSHFSLLVSPMNHSKQLSVLALRDLAYQVLCLHYASI